MRTEALGILQPEREDEVIATAVADVQIFPSIGETLVSQRWLVRDARVAQVCRGMVQGLCN